MENRIDTQLLNVDFTSISKNGTLSHMINLRPDGNVLRPIGKKKVVHDITLPISTKGLFLHDTPEWSAWVGLDSEGYLFMFSETSTLKVRFDRIITGDYSLLEIKSFKNYLYAITETEMRVYFGHTTDNVTVAYKLANVYDFRKLKFVISPSGDRTEYTGKYWLNEDEEDVYKARMLDDIYKLEKKMSSEEGGLPGICWFRVGLRLFDDSVLFPSQPVLPWGAKVDQRFQSKPVPGNSNYVYARAILSSNLFTLNIPSATVDAMQADSNLGTAIGSIKNFVKGVELFASAPSRVFSLDKIDRSVLNKDIFYSEFLGIDEQFRDNGNDPDVWYKVGSYNLEDLAKNIGENGYVFEKINLKNYWLDYATKETYSFADESWHKSTPVSSVVYNGRLHLGDIKVQLSDGYLFQQIDDNVFDRTVKGTAPGQIVYHSTNSEQHTGYAYNHIKTSEGERIVRTPITYKAYKEYSYNGTTYSLAGTNNRLFALPGVIGYPDRRAYKVRFTVVKPTTTDEYTLTEVALKASVNSNFAQYVNTPWSQARENGFKSNPAFSPAEFATYKYSNFTTVITSFNGTTFTSLVRFYPQSSYLNEYYDQNRVIVSETDNPFTFLPKHSYRVGDGRVVAMTSISETVSQGQFGQYPLVCLTSKGIFGLAQGDNGILYASVAPMNSEVCIGRNTLPIHGGVAFISERGIALLSGKEVLILSEPLATIVSDSYTPNPLRADSLYNTILTHPQLFGMGNYENTLSDIRSIITADTALAFDRSRNELIISDPSWLKHIYFSFTTKSFYFGNESFISTSDTYSEHYALTSGGKIVSICSKTLGMNQGESDDPVQIMLQTKPINFGREIGINDLEILADINTPAGKYINVALWGNESKRTDKWFCLGGIQCPGNVNLLHTNKINRMKVQEVIVLITAVCEYNSWIAPAISLNVKQKFNQIKS